MTKVADTPQEQRNVSEEDRRKAKLFFDRAKTNGETGQYDYAITLFFDGLAIDPDSVEAHQSLREISLKRKAGGGKSLGIFEKAKIKTNTKDDKLNMLAYERLLTFDPGEMDYMVGLMQNALRCGFVNTVMWIGPIIMLANTQARKPEKRKFLSVKDAYKELKKWPEAIQACQFAQQLDPNDPEISDEIKNLSANESLKDYDNASSFQDVIKDKEGQQRDWERDRDVTTEDIMLRNIREAQAEFDANPNEPGKINKLAEALLKTEDIEKENQAIELLDDAYKRLARFSFRQRLGQARLDQMRRMERSLKSDYQANPKDESLKKDYEGFVTEMLEQELAEFTLWSENYPTDLAIKYEIGVRLFQLKKFDDAIPVLQVARSEPKKRYDAGILLGCAFLETGFVDEAVETLQQIAEEYPTLGDDRSKRLFYWLGRAFETKGVLDQAISRYSRVAQWEFKYSDVQQRIKTLRAQNLHK